MTECKREFEMFGAVTWAGSVDGSPAVVTAYKNGASVWKYKRKLFFAGSWVREAYDNVTEALEAAGAK